ncbi:LysR family transcriptional regulator, partial [candidate division WOR-3 bacterium]|nr:LysR family transcriptional regulator [candidate division WOR-3 bacterium]
MIELQNLRTFCAVAEKKSFTKAGELVYRTQSTISSQISELEKLYDTTLFDRSQREIALTESGEILYHYAKRILKLVDESRDKIDELKDVVKGNLIIGASTIPGTYILPGVLNGFKQKYPDVNVSVQISNSKDIITKILEHRLEVGAVGEKVEDKRLEYIELA